MNRINRFNLKKRERDGREMVVGEMVVDEMVDSKMTWKIN